jgi:putative acetyltransferase
LLDNIHAQSPHHIQQVKDLIAEFSAWDNGVTASLGYDLAQLDYQYSESMLQLPGEFAPPDGCLLLALVDSQPAGCIAYRHLDSTICELKRMYVRPQFQGQGVGWALVETLLSEAHRAGYTQIYLETVTFMKSAHALYNAAGFRDIPPYYEIPSAFAPITMFMALELPTYA